MNDVQNDLMQNIGSGGNDTKMRKYLMIGGGVFVVFVVGIVIAKFAFSSPKQNTDVVLLPEMKTISDKSNKGDTDLFNSIPIDNSKANDSKKEPKKEVVKQEVKQKEKKFKKPVVEDVEENKLPVEPLKVEKVMEKPKKENIKKGVKAITKNYPYFIQVAAVTRGEPSKKFLKLIEKNGFHYKIQMLDIKGVKVKRVLIGGFATSKEAKAVLPKVKQKLSSSAFIKKLK